jgi:molybdate transport system permease protein
MGRRAFALTSFLALVVLLVFLILPIVAIFTHTGPGRLIDALGDHSAREALRLSFETSAIAMLLIAVIGTPAAYLLATRNFRGRAAVLTLIELPLIVPPAVAGLALLAAFGPNGILGSALSDAGVELVFETAGVVVALTFVASPFYVRGAVAAFAAVPTSMIEASEQLGARPLQTLLSVAIPSARPGLLAGFLSGVRAGARGIRRDADVRWFVPGHHPDGAARDLRRVQHGLHWRPRPRPRRHPDRAVSRPAALGEAGRRT